MLTGTQGSQVMDWKNPTKKMNGVIMRYFAAMCHFNKKKKERFNQLTEHQGKYIIMIIIVQC